MLHVDGDLKLPCGKCDECITKRAVEFATRAKHEISTHKENCFLTLTYNDDNRPETIIKRDFQLFAKSLRKKLNKKIKYMVSYEYGSKTNLPHMHAIIFGYNPSNQKLIKSNSGYPLFTSHEIENLWDKGFHSIGDANEKTAYYIASYALKSAEKEVINPETGEYSLLKDSMDCSRGIGLEYFKKYHNSLLDSDTILPRYYRKKLKDLSDRKPKKGESIKDANKRVRYWLPLYETYEEKVSQMIKNRSDHEIFAKFTIKDQKNSLHSTVFRENCGINKKDYRSFREKEFLKFHLQHNRDKFAKGLKHG